MVVGDRAGARERVASVRRGVVHNKPSESWDTEDNVALHGRALCQVDGRGGEGDARLVGQQAHKTGHHAFGDDSRLDRVAWEQEFGCPPLAASLDGRAVSSVVAA